MKRGQSDQRLTKDYPRLVHGRAGYWGRVQKSTIICTHSQPSVYNVSVVQEVDEEEDGDLPMWKAAIFKRRKDKVSREQEEEMVRETTSFGYSCFRLPKN